MARAARQIRLSGIFPAAITPHHPKTREADYSGALELIDFLAAAGVDGICLFGSTGEFINYSFAERHRLLSLAVKRSRVPLIAGVSYEIIRFAAKRFSAQRGVSLFALMTAPGLWLQRITTQPPDDSEVECAIRALDEAMKLEKQRGGELVIA